MFASDSLPASVETGETVPSVLAHLLQPNESFLPFRQAEDEGSERNTQVLYEADEEDRE